MQRGIEITFVRLSRWRFVPLIAGAIGLLLTLTAVGIAHRLHEWFAMSMLGWTADEAARFAGCGTLFVLLVWVGCSAMLIVMWTDKRRWIIDD